MNIMTELIIAELDRCFKRQEELARIEAAKTDEQRAEEQVARDRARREEVAATKKNLLSDPRLAEMCERAVGKPLNIRVGKNEINRGFITKVEVHGTRVRARSVVTQFRVHYAMGKLNFEPVILESLPR